jgi:DNA polymerase
MNNKIILDELATVEEKCKNCTKCELYKSKINTVFSDGKPNGKLMLIGEAPGANEDQQGKPFVGKSGQLLDKIFESVGLLRENDVYICNTIKCRPPGNRNPLPEEQLLCREYLDSQIEILKPRIILLCGAVATVAMLNSKEGITKIRGKWFDGPYNSKMMPIFHPAYLLRNQSREVGSPKWLMYQDIKEIKKEYDLCSVEG